VPYDRDKDGYCERCRAKRKLVRCFKCNGKANGRTTTCAACNSTGYVCEKANGDAHHKWWR
jgi:hypothetical protein